VLLAAGRWAHHSPMSDSRAILWMLVCGALVSSCTQDPKPTPYEFVEWVQVDGSCQEDHATQGGHYSGDMVHWRNKATGVSRRYGSVNNFDSSSPEAMLAEVKQPNRYHPPFSINFDNVAASDFQSQSFVLHGVSDDTNHGGGYEATCRLTVQRRLDHLPSNEERRAWSNPRAAR
jgi:hypothetical protein